MDSYLHRADGRIMPHSNSGDSFPPQDSQQDMYERLQTRTQEATPDATDRTLFCIGDGADGHG